MRELDQEIEATELRLREIVAAAIDTNDLIMPERIAAKVRDRIQKDRRKGLLTVSEENTSTIEELQYCDLRELEDLIVSKPTWPIFACRFDSKEQLIARFAQLAELRNAIRHTRSVSQLAQKDGEAALMWFQSKIKVHA